MNPSSLCSSSAARLRTAVIAARAAVVSMPPRRAAPPMPARISAAAAGRPTGSSARYPGAWRRSWSLSPAAADVGGVGHPVAAGGVLPGNGDVDVDAEHAGEQGGGQFGGELEQRGGAVDGDVAGGEPADPGDGLGIEEHEQAGEAVPGVQCVVVQQAAGGVPAPLVIECPCRALPAGGEEGQRSETVPGGPADEVPGVVALTGGF